MSRLVTDSTGNNLTFKIIGAAMKVNNEIGPGFKEEIYERALLAELNNLDLIAIGQYPVSVEYEDQQVAVFYLDIFVENQVVVEIKAFSHQITNDERAQVINYLKATEAQTGLLINFGRRKLDFKRVFPGKNLSPVQRLGRDNVYKSRVFDDPNQQ